MTLDYPEQISACANVASSKLIDATQKFLCKGMITKCSRYKIVEFFLSEKKPNSDPVSVVGCVKTYNLVLAG